MAGIDAVGAWPVSSNLKQMLDAPDLAPGSPPSYELCKAIFTDHVLGAKIAETPIDMAMNESRHIEIQNGPESRIKDKFISEWEALGCDATIKSCATLSRVYGVCSVVLAVEDYPSDKPIKPEQLPGLTIAFNVLDPLNTAGSLVLNQDANAIDFLKPTGTITAAGQPYHRSRAVVLMNENPVFLDYSTSAFGYVGRSVYQRVLYPLKSFVSTMIANDMVARKAGLIVAKIKQPSSIADRMMAGAIGQKRELLKVGENGDVLSIGEDDSVESIPLMNVDASLAASRQNIIEDIAAGAPMPSMIISSQTFSQSRGDGTEDAKAVAQFIDGIRRWMRPLYDYFDTICMYRAWTPEFYETIQNDYPEYRGIPFETAFADWRNSFFASWPSFLKEPESEQIEVEKVTFEAALGLYRELSTQVDPENRARLAEWLQDNMNSKRKLFSAPLDLDFEALAQYEPPDPGKDGPRAAGMDF